MLTDRKPPVALLVLNFNGRRFLPDCLRSLAKTKWPRTIYLIDNGSNDGSVDYVRTNHPDVRVISYSRNLGFSDAYNRAVKTIGEEYVLFLNNDIKVENPRWLTDMMSLLSESDNIGAVGAKTVDMHDGNVLDSVGGTVWRWIGIGIRTGGEEVDLGQYDNPPNEPFYVSGVVFLTKKSLFLKVGGFDPQMFAYSEDLDLCWRMRLLGYSIRYCPKAIIRHSLSASWEQMGERKHYLSCRNFLRSSLKNYSTLSIMKELPPYLLVSFIVGMMLSVMRETPAFVLANVHAIVWNLVNMKNTFTKRRMIQRNRLVDDAAILKSMGPSIGTLSEMRSRRDYLR